MVPKAELEPRTKKKRNVGYGPFRRSTVVLINTWSPKYTTHIETLLPDHTVLRKPEFFPRIPFSIHSFRTGVPLRAS